MHLFFVFGILCFVTSCQEEDDYSDVDTPATNTVIMLMPWAGTEYSQSSLYSYLLDNIRTIENTINKAGSMGTTRLFVCISNNSRNGYLIEIKYDKNRSACVRDTIESYDYPGSDLRNIMINRLSTIKSISNTKNYSIIVGSHGMGWVPLDGPRKISTRYYGGLSDPYKFTGEDLSIILKNAGIHTQYILFDACYSANVETAFDLRNSCDYIIGTTSELLDYGMPYQKIWQYLSMDTPDYYNICQEFYNFYSSYIYPYGTLSVVKSAELERLANIMKEINSNYDVERMIEDGTLVPESVQTLDGFSPSIFYDMKDYVSRICEDKELLDKFSNQFDLTVPFRVATPKILSVLNNQLKYITLNTYSGLSISDLTTSNEFNASIKKKETNWWKATH